jgi:protein-disulfide isomerase
LSPNSSQFSRSSKVCFNFSHRCCFLDPPYLWYHPPHMNETTSGGMNMSTLLVPGSVILAGLLIAGAVYWNNQHPSATTPTGTGQQPTVNISNVKTDGEPYIGNPSAQITIAEWSDYQCPFCKQFELTTLPQIVQTYVIKAKRK